MKVFLRRYAIFLSLLPVLAVMVAIFWFSSQHGAASHETSGGIVTKLLKLFYPYFLSLSHARQLEIEKIVSHLVRKCAHLTEYAILGCSLLCHVTTWRMRCRVKYPRAIAFAVGALYAVSDELHQRFVQGRSGEVKDVLLDCVGVAAGVLILWLAMRKPLRKQSNNESSASIVTENERNITL